MDVEAMEQWRQLRAQDIPAVPREVVRHCLLDWLGCALAGSREPLSAILRQEVLGPSSFGTRSWAGDQATIVGTGARAGVRTAALVNGAAGHALDFDDTHTGLGGHPSAPVLPAVLALAERLDSPGGRLLTALVAGIEVECRIAERLGPGHYAIGWHATGTMGTFGAAAGAANLLGLDAGAWGHALGLAGTQAAGLKASFGTMAKPLHAGKAASDGLLAALLARGGFTGEPDIVDAPQGLGAAAGGRRGEGSGRREGPDSRWLCAQTLFKYHASCYLTHAAINAAQSLRQAGLEPERVGRVEVRVAPGCLDVCAIPSPLTGLEGKFSLRATTAMALLGDETADPGAFEDGRMGQPDLVAMRDRVTVVGDAGLLATRAVVSVKCRDGEHLLADDDTGQPAPDLSRQWERLSDKFMALATPVVGAQQAGAVQEAVARIEDLSSVRQLTALLGPDGSEARED